MTYDEISALWKADGGFKIDRSEDLYIRVLEKPSLHEKYWKISTKEAWVLQSLENQKKILIKDIYEYYKGLMPDERLKELGWDEWQRTLIKGEFEIYFNAHPLVIDINNKIFGQKQKLEFLKEIIKVIHDYTWMIKEAIEYLKFENGIGG